ncbi:MAG: phosphatidate cytidylyltransferase, partial [Bacteroidetes bacterium]|nr:phosphatidate cytidylyltransferase [Bacteroidota bacterium]
MIFWKYISIYLVLSIVGGIGLLKASGKLDPIKQRENRIKYFMYLLLIVLMTACIIAGVTVYIWVVAILIFFCIRELASISGNLRKRGNSRWILYGALVYLAMMSGFLFSVVLSPERLLFLYTNVVVFDGFSQVVGQLLGKHKMVPKISPGKTWEGLLGGMVFMSLSYFILRGDAGSVMPVRDYFLV